MKMAAIRTNAFETFTYLEGLGRYRSSFGQTQETGQFRVPANNLPLPGGKTAVSGRFLYFK